MTGINNDIKPRLTCEIIKREEVILENVTAMESALARSGKSRVE
tara:strand:- start:285 stop:416 length:132 start_codon:yes stop_codon:yes gene_type:complete